MRDVIYLESQLPGHADSNRSGCPSFATGPIGHGWRWHWSQPDSYLHTLNSFVQQSPEVFHLWICEICKSNLMKLIQRWNTSIRTQYRTNPRKIAYTNPMGNLRQTVDFPMMMSDTSQIPSMFGISIGDTSCQSLIRLHSILAAYRHSSNVRNVYWNSTRFWRTH